MKFLFGALLLVIFNGSTYAAIITYNFTGQLNSVNPLLSSAFTNGTVVTGSYSFDTSGVDSNSDPTASSFYFPISATVTAGGFTKTSSFTSLAIFNDLVLGVNTTRDAYMVSLNGDNSLTNGLRYAGFGFNIYNQGMPPQGPFSSDGIPTTPPLVADFTFNRMSFDFLDSTNSQVYSAVGYLTSISPDVVPEPNVLILTLTALTALVVSTRSRRAKWPTLPQSQPTLAGRIALQRTS